MNYFLRGIITLFLWGFLSLDLSYAQETRKNDLIVLKDSTKIEAFVKEVLETLVKYKKLSDPEGPLFTLNKSDISVIRYGNGEVQNFQSEIAVSNYFIPNGQQQPQPVTTAPTKERYAAPMPRNEYEKSLLTATPSQLRSIYNYRRTKSKNGIAIGAAGVTVGTILATVGTVKIASVETDANGNYYNYQDKMKAQNGAKLLLGGVLGGTVLGVVGFVTGGKNGSKATRAKRELQRRGEPITYDFSPSFNLQNGTASLAVRIKL